MRDVPWAVVVFFILSIFSVSLGILVDNLPDFWRGVLLGSGGGLIASIFLLRPPSHRKPDIAALPQPSERVLALCNDPSSSFVKAVKVYREESGVTLAEATAVLRHYQNRFKKNPD